jgi:hypothetical protein
LRDRSRKRMDGMVAEVLARAFVGGPAEEGHARIVGGR